MGYARLGLALSKKSIAKAHDRNKVKRLLRETFRIRNMPSIDVIVLARKRMEHLEQSLTVKNLSNLWDKLCIK